MNERMAELFGQAGISDSINEEFGIEYLAELVVRECAGICDRVEDEYLNNEQLPSNEKYAIGAGVCRNTLYNHFGVK